MASDGQKALSGAAQGAAAGAALGPMGMAVGGIVGGIGGLLSGNDGPAPAPVYTPPPTAYGGFASQYGGMQIDPNTGKVIYTNNNYNTGNTVQGYTNNLMQGYLTGSNAANMDLNSQITNLQNYIKQLSSTDPNVNTATQRPDLQKYVGQGWNSMLSVKEDGSVDDSKLKEAMANPNGVDRSSPLFQTFMAETGGGYGSKNQDISFGKWVKDAYARNVQPALDKYANDNKTVLGNTQTNTQALQAAQTQLDNLMQLQQSGSTAQQDFQQSPLMAALNKTGQFQQAMGPNGANLGSSQNAYDTLLGRGLGQQPTYDELASKFGSPNQKTTQGLFDQYAGQAFDNTTQDSTAFKIAGMQNPNYQGPQAGNDQLLAKYDELSGKLGGPGVSMPQTFDRSRIADFIGAADRQAQNAAQNQMNLSRDQDARRGVMGGSDIADFQTRMGLEDQLVKNHAQGLGLGMTMDQNDIANRMQAEQFNSNAQAQGAGQSISALQSILGQNNSNLLAAQQMYNGLQNTAWGNNQNFQNQRLGNAAAALGLNSGLNQQTYNQASGQQGFNQGAAMQDLGAAGSFLGANNGMIQQGNQAAAQNNTGNQQFYQNQLGMLGYLSGQNQQNYNQNIGNAQMALGQGQLGASIGQGNTANQMSYNANQAAQQNAFNMANWQQQMAQNAQTQQAWGQVASGLGSVDWSNWGGSKTPIADNFTNLKAQGAQPVAVPQTQSLFTPEAPLAQRPTKPVQ